MLYKLEVLLATQPLPRANMKKSGGKRAGVDVLKGAATGNREVEKKNKMLEIKGKKAWPRTRLPIKIGHAAFAPIVIIWHHFVISSSSSTFDEYSIGHYFWF